MSNDEIEPKILELWVKTRIPLTRAHIQYYTSAPRKRLTKLLDAMVDEGALEIDVDDDGALVYAIPGAARSVDGPTTFAEFEKKQAMLEDARQRIRQRRGLAPKPAKTRPSSGDTHDDGNNKLQLHKTALSLTSKALGALDRPNDTGKGDKSLLLSAGLSLMGPLGWLYAGSFREAIPAVLLTMAVAAVVPNLLLMPILWLAMPASAVAGLIYAWQYNRSGQRKTIFIKGSGDEED